MATTGCRPARAMPAAEVTACCSAIPTSKVRSGKTRWNPSSPVGYSIAAVTATMSVALHAQRHQLRPEDVGVARLGHRDRAGPGVEGAERVEVVLLRAAPPAGSPCPSW